jgi:two-component system, OmpR family, sensor histidine kinase KdpD
MDNQRPDPERLLAMTQRETAMAGRGKLRVFLGMAAGVGKTYAMLEEAQGRLATGEDVVVGFVETHGRSETEALLQGLPTIPRRVVEYHGVNMEEFDLDAALARHPQLVLVDELAHTNAAGSRHPKRYQDVVELLDAGIDVYTTLNVQHIESRADAVREITGITIHETVPDSMLEQAHDVALVDLSPDDLLRRLSEGKVYLGEAGEIAARNFFRRGNLTALREMALRLTAERVDHQLQEYMTVRRIPGPWKSREHLLVGVGPSPAAPRLVRAARRLAYSLDAPWDAVFVESSHPLSEAQQAVVTKALDLARQLGAEVITTADEDLSGALLRVARQRNVTQIVVGSPSRAHRWRPFGSSFVDRLVHESGAIDVYVITGEAERQERQGRPRLSLPRQGSQYLVATAAIALVTAANLALVPLIGYRSVAILYLLVVSVLSLGLNRWPVLLAATLSAILWDVLFIPPRFTLVVHDLADALTLVMYFLVAIVTGTLNARLRAQEQAVRRREERATSLYTLARAVASARTLDDILHTAVEQIGRAFDADVTIMLAGSPDGLLAQPHPASAFTIDEKELAVAGWAFENGREAGRFTDTLPAAAAQYIPLQAPGGTVGVMAVRAHDSAPPTIDQRTLLETFARQVALVIERATLDEAARRTSVLTESERLYKTLLNSVSHELRTPLAAITGAASSLLEPEIRDDAAVRDSLSRQIEEAAGRLNRVIENLLNMTRLESGRLSLHLEWCDMADLISVALRRAAADLEQHELTVAIAPDLPLMRVDFGLLEQALYNLLHNAAVHTPPGTPVRLTAAVNGQEMLIAVADHGPGIPDEDVERVFGKFYCAPGTGKPGTGLGLSITRALIEAHGGTITAENQGGGGVRFTIRLPLAEQPPMPPEEHLTTAEEQL